MYQNKSLSQSFFAKKKRFNIIQQEKIISSPKMNMVRLLLGTLHLDGQIFSNKNQKIENSLLYTME